VIELRFHKELYDGFAIDEAVKAFASFARFELAREPEGYVVRLTGEEAAGEEAVVAAEFATHALGLSLVAMGDPERVPQTPPVVATNLSEERP